MSSLNPLASISPMHQMKPPSSLPSGVPLQLDRLLPLLLSDHLGCGPLRGHLGLRPLPHQMGPHSQGTHIFYCFLDGSTCLSRYIWPVFSSPHTFLVTLMDSTGCGGSSWCWVSTPKSWIGAGLARFESGSFIIFPLLRLLVIPARFHQLCQNPQDG